jgi:hypothetical protein
MKTNDALNVIIELGFNFKNLSCYWLESACFEWKDVPTHWVDMLIVRFSGDEPVSKDDVQVIYEKVPMRKKVFAPKPTD